VIGVVQQPPVAFGPLDWAIFLLANAIILLICWPKLRDDIVRWRKRG
jgi:hypothetical protein